MICLRCLACSVLFFASVVSAGFLSAQTADHRALCKQGVAEIDAGKFDEAYRTFSRARELDSKNANSKYWFLYLSVYMGQNAIYAGDHQTALRHLTTALGLKKELSSAEDLDFITIRRLIDMVKEHAVYSKIKPQYVHTFQALYIKNTDLKDTFDSRGTPVISKGSLTESQISGSFNGQKMLKFYIETLTRGRVSLSFERKVLDATLTRAVIYVEKKKGTAFRPDFNSTTESLGPIFFEGRNRFDTTIIYFNNEKFDVMWFANGVPSIYIPYTWYGERRGSVVLPQFQGVDAKKSLTLTRFPYFWIHLHEFFHVIEWMSGGIRPMHAYVKEAMDQARKNYPEWVPDMNPSYTATEYSWYRYQMHNTVPERMEKKAAETGLYPPFRNFSFVLTKPDRTEEYLYQTYTKAVGGITLDNLRKASELLEQAYKLRREKKNDESVRMLRKALEHNPCHHQVLLELGREALGRQENAEADRYFSTLARVFPDPKELFAIAKSFFDRSAFALAAKYFRIAAERPGRNPVYTRWLGKALIGAGEHDAAETALAQIGANPVMKSQTAYIVNKSAGQALHSSANPEDRPSPGLAGPRRQDAYRWKLVSSGERDHVLIVSDYNWNCLEVRGGKGNYGIIQSEIDQTDSRKWRLVKGSDGLYRIISKISGTPLAVVVPGDRKKPALTLKADNADAHRYWEIQVLDSALNRMEYERRVSIFSKVNDKAVDLFAGKPEDGATICLWPRTGNSNQWWKFLPSDDAGFVYIVSENSWKCLSARRENGRMETVQMSITGDAAQKWKVVSKGTDGYMLINKGFNRALEVDPAKPSSRTIRLGEINDAPSQLWKLEY